MEQKGILEHIKLPNKDFDALWEKIIVPDELKERLLSQAILEFTLRGKTDPVSVPLHGIMLLVGPPGTGKTSLARGLANRVAESFKGQSFQFVAVEPHALASSGLGKSQQAVRDLLQSRIAEHADAGPLIVLLDEVETLSPDRKKMSMESNPIDVHRATDAVLASVDYLASKYPHLLFIATSNFTEVVDEAFLSRADLIEIIGLPTEPAIREIVTDTLQALAKASPSILSILKDPKFASLIKACVGLDGRQIRKAILAACASKKEVALDTNLLTIDMLEQSVQRKKEYERPI